MSKKLTIQVSDEFYDGLQRRVGKRGIGRFLEEIARPHVIRPNRGDPGWEDWVEGKYRQKAAEEAADPEYAAEMRCWMETGVDEGLPDDWDEWRRRYGEWKQKNASGGRLVGGARADGWRRDRQDPPGRHHLERPLQRPEQQGPDRAGHVADAPGL